MSENKGDSFISKEKPSVFTPPAPRGGDNLRGEDPRIYGQRSIIAWSGLVYLISTILYSYTQACPCGSAKNK